MVDAWTWKDALEMIPGVGALLGAAVGYGKLKQEVADLRAEVSGLGNQGERIARIEATTGSMGAQVNRIEGKLDRLLERR